MNIEDIKKKLKDFSNEEIKKLLADVKHENEKRKANMLYKWDMNIYKGLCESLYKFEEDYDYSYDENASDEKKQKDNLQVDVIRNVEQSILAICDYTLGNYRAFINTMHPTGCSPKRVAGSTPIPSGISSDYISMKNELLEIIDKYSKKEVHEDIFKERQPNKNTR